MLGIAVGRPKERQLSFHERDRSFRGRSLQNYSGTWGGMGEDTLHHARGNPEPTYFRYLAATLGCLNLTAANRFRMPISSCKELFAVSIFTATIHEKKQMLLQIAAGTHILFFKK